MKKRGLHRRQLALVKLFFLLAVIVVIAGFATTYWYMFNHRMLLPQVAVTQTPTAAEREPERKTEVMAVPENREIKLCELIVTLPDVGLTELREDIGDYWDIPGVCRYYNGDNFTILVVDKNAIPSSDFSAGSSAQVKAFNAFGHYLLHQTPADIIDIAMTDGEFDGVRLRTLYDKITNNSVSYTANMGQDQPGRGVYQTATYLGQRYLVYLSYRLFEEGDIAWQTYFTDNVKYSSSTETDNFTELFRSYMKKQTAKPEVQNIIKEINASTKSIKLAN